MCAHAQPFAQSCWIGAGTWSTSAAFATGEMVARLRAKNAARMMYVIGNLNLSSGEMSGLSPHMDICGSGDNPDLADWIYAASAEMG
jgi:hypothetical protein